jgi:hypothetical protein
VKKGGKCTEFGLEKKKGFHHDGADDDKYEQNFVAAKSEQSRLSKWKRLRKLSSE